MSNHIIVFSHNGNQICRQILHKCNLKNEYSKLLSIYATSGEFGLT